MQAILFIESNTSGTGKLFLSTAIDLGYHPILLSTNFAKYSFTNEIGEWIKLESHDFNHVLNVISRIQEHHQIAAVTSSSEYYIHLAARIAQSKNIRGEVAETVELCRNKLKLRERLKEQGFNCPRFAFVKHADEVHHALQHIQLPCVIKPVSGTGSLHVVLCKTEEEVYFNAHNILTSENASQLGVGVMIETYIEGAEYSAEIFNGSVVGITKKHLGSHPYFLEVGHDFPAALGIDEQKKVTAVISRVVSALRLTFGPYHMEFRLNETGLWVIEINPRLAGGFIPIIVKHATGVDLIKATLENLLSEHNIKIKHAISRASSIRFLVLEKRGTVKDIRLPKTTISFEHELYKKLPFEHPIKSNDFRDRVGHIITVEETVHQAKINADELLRLTELFY
jgi:biotin carboxylase